MADERSRRGLNPNAQAFTPNPAARPFIPGQPYVFTAQPPPLYHHPPPCVVQGAYHQQCGQMEMKEHTVQPSVDNEICNRPTTTTAAPLTAKEDAPVAQSLSPLQQQQYQTPADG